MPTERDPLIRTTSPCFQMGIQPLGRLTRVGDEFVGIVVASQRTDPEDEVDARDSRA